MLVVVGVLSITKRKLVGCRPCHIRRVVICLRLIYHRFQFYATIGDFSSGENRVSAAVNHTIYGASTKLLLSV